MMDEAAGQEGFDAKAELSSLSAEPIHADSPRESGLLRKAAASLGWRIFVLDGRKMDCKESLMEELARGLSLPGYFGRNWDALEECLTEPGVMGEKVPGWLVCVSNWDAARTADATESRTLIEVLGDASRYWQEQSPPRFLKTVLLA